MVFTGGLSASVITLEEYGLFLSSDSFSHPVQDSYIYLPERNLDNQGFSLFTENNLGANSLGDFSWTVTNSSHQTYFGINSIIYLNAAIDPAENTYFNENATFLGNTQATSWEADDAWYPDIHFNVATGQLTNQNWVAPGYEGDVALALGFYIPELKQGDTFKLTMSLSTEDIGGWYHFDPDSNFGFYFNSALAITTAKIPVPEPGTLALGLGSLRLTRNRQG